MLFEEFSLDEIPVTEGTLRVRHGGDGPPLLLLHGNPQTHYMWHRVAPRLAKHFTVICPDLRGYGKSFKPEASTDHAPYSKRRMALDMIELMDYFGHHEFFVGAHDRGARVAHRLALDHPQRVKKLSVLDIIPTVEHFERTDMAFAMGYYHWFWLAQPHPVPETFIGSDPTTWFQFQTSIHKSNDSPETSVFHPIALADYLDAIQQPETIRGICEDYRAAATIDLIHDRESRAANKRIRCPLQVLWGEKGSIGRWYKPLEIWRAYCDSTVVGGSVDSGHYLAEEAPEAVFEHFKNFFDDSLSQPAAKNGTT